MIPSLARVICPLRQRRAHGHDDSQTKAGREDEDDGKAACQDSGAKEVSADAQALTLSTPPGYSSDTHEAATFGGLYYRGMPMAEAISEPELTFKSTPKAVHVAHAWLSSPVFLELASEAMRRRQHPDALTAAIVERVILAGLVDFLLDDPRFS